MKLNLRPCQVFFRQSLRGSALVVLLLCGFLLSARAQKPLPAAAQVLGTVPESAPMTASVFLQPDPERAAALASFLSDLQTPGSPAFHQWLTPTAFANRFGATDAQIAALSQLASASGLRVEQVTGLRVQLSGPASAFEAAFAPALRRVAVNGTSYISATQALRLPAGALAVGGLETLQLAPALNLLLDAQPAPALGQDPLSALATTLDANTARVLTLSTTACAGDFAPGQRSAFALLLQQAAAQGITVLTESACPDATQASFPASLPEAPSFTVTPAATALLEGQARPAWQTAPGLPADGLRHAPDATVSSAAAFSQAVTNILAKLPAGADGTPARLGNIAATLYALGPEPGLFHQSDGAPAGTWEPATGLGVLDLDKLQRALPFGSYTNDVSISVSKPGATHGDSITFSSTVKDTSGKTTATPTGTVTWSTNNGITLGPQTLVNGTASVTTSTLPAAYGYTITAQYSGDTNYAASSSSTGFTVLPEPAVVSATVSPSTPLGGTIAVAVTVTSKSGVGTPSGTASVVPQGTADKNTYTAPLASTTAGTATATVSVPAVQGGNVVLLVGCVSASNDFSCYVPVQSSATVTTGKSATAIVLSTSGANTTLTATVTGAGANFPLPTGNVSFSDNGQSIGSGTLAASTASTTAATASTSFPTPPSGTHSYTATFAGDNNYSGSTSPAAATGTSPTTTSLAVSPNPPVSGTTTTLTASVAYTSTGSAAPTGTVAFYMDGTQLGSTAITGGTTATYTSTTLGSVTAHTFYAVYSGDSVYQTSQSPNVATAAQAAGTTTTTLAVSPNPPVSGSATTLTAAVASTPSGTSVPSGSVAFYMDATLIGTGKLAADGKSASFTSTTIGGAAAHAFYAKYSGDSNFLTSQSPVVNTAATGSGSTGLVLTVTPNPPVTGTTTTLAAALTFTSTGTAPTGSVSFLQDGAKLAAAPVSNTGVASYTSTTLDGAASHTYTAAYSGDTNYAAAQSIGVKTQGTSPNATTIVVASSAAVVATGGKVTLTATVAPGTAAGAAPTGLVTFTSSLQGKLGTAALVAGVASLSPVLTTQGAQQITASYAGDTTYQPSVSAAPAGITVGPAAGLTLTVTPTSTTYGSSVTLTTVVTGTSVSGTPAATVSWSVTPNAGGTAQTYTAALAPTSSSTGTASVTIAAPSVGTYGVTATCASTDMPCTGLTSSTGFAVTKAPTNITISASPAVPAPGTPELLTAYVNLSSGASAACTGSISFYVNGAFAGSSGVNSNQATYILTLPSTNSNSVYALYTGDTNCSPSTSTPFVLSIPPTSTTGAVSVGNSTALQGATVTFTAVINSVATTTNQNPGSPTGYVNFYDTVNGIQTQLGSVALTQNGPATAIATFSTTGLQPGPHSIDAQFTGSAKYSPVDAGVAVVLITDFTATFSPPTASVTKGQPATTLMTVVPVNGFAGQIALACTPPASTYTTCTVTPAVLTNGGGVATVTIGTTAATHTLTSRGAAVAGFAGLVSAALTLCWPGCRRRRIPLLAVLALATVFSLSGCTTVQSETTTLGGGAGGSTGGTPSGTQMFTITASGTDGRTTNRHSYTFQLTVQ